MNYHVIVPFGVVVLAWVLGGAIITIVGAAAVEALGWLMSWLMNALIVLLKFLFAIVTFGGGGFLFFVGAYRLARVLAKRLHERVWPTVYLFWVAMGLFAFSYGFTMLFEKQLTRQVAYEHAWETPKWFFWTETHSETRYRTESTAWLSISEMLKTGGRWLLLFGAGALVVEFCIRRRRDFQAVASATAKDAHETAKRAKKALDGPT